MKVKRSGRGVDRRERGRSPPPCDRSGRSRRLDTQQSLKIERQSVNHQLIWTVTLLFVSMLLLNVMCFPLKQDVVMGHAIVYRCDICLLQNVVDPDRRAINSLLSSLNRYDGYNYKSVSSKGLGNSPDDMQQYVFIYRTQTVNVTDRYQYESKPRTFVREPFAVQFQSENTGDGGERKLPCGGDAKEPRPSPSGHAHHNPPHLLRGRPLPPVIVCSEARITGVHMAKVTLTEMKTSHTNRKHMICFHTMTV
ncbi:hypothetical protein F2P81_011362 [Scophthalmus maximus]|uniref:Uncharacterized protein n=1 Tax=Scophthalmus maximus TaxID=52904 RepID=A0A6A4SW05_SCOMX|nr:hypothetical protein F2P81_011362 [Scophthalmus maximus]